jgi:hypothetical protein
MSFWEKASEIRRVAAKTADPAVRSELVDIARRFERLAVHADEPPPAVVVKIGGAALVAASPINHHTEKPA